MEGQFFWGATQDGWRKGPWTPQEDKILTEHVNIHGEGRWNSISRLTGLKRSGKSCRLRWVNYLRPDLKKGKITPQEEAVILDLHARWGNRWSTIARSLPGRTDNEIKNYWRTHYKNKGKSTKNIEKQRAKFLRHQQQQKLQNQQLNPLVKENNNAEDTLTTTCINDATKMDKEMMYMCNIPHMFEHGGGGSTTINGDDLRLISGDEWYCYDTWGSLWNLDDVEFGIIADEAYNLF